MATLNRLLRGCLQRSLLPFARSSSTRTASCNPILTWRRSFASRHLAADQSLAKRLKTELNAERQSIDVLPTSISGFKLDVSSNYQSVVLNNKIGDEKITLTMNINVSGSIENDSDDDEEFIVYPSFTVNITRKNGISLEMNCSIDEGYDDGVSEEDDSFTYYIDDVTIIPKDVPPEQALMMNTTSLNDDILDVLKDYLEERGINDKLTGELIDLHSKLEQQMYVNFLENLKSFVET